MQAEHITIVDNRQKYRARLQQAWLADQLNISLLKKIILVKLYSKG